MLIIKGPTDKISRNLMTFKTKKIPDVLRFTKNIPGRDVKDVEDISSAVFEMKAGGLCWDNDTVTVCSWFCFFSKSDHFSVKLLDTGFNRN